MSKDKDHSRKLTPAELKAFRAFAAADAERASRLHDLQARVAESEGAVMRAARKTLDLGQAEMAERLEMSVSHLSRVEGGKVAAGPALLRAVALLLGE